MYVNNIISLFVFVITTNLLHAQTAPTKEQQQARQSIIRFFDALSNRDTTGLKASCTRDVTLIEYGQLWNLDTLIRNVAGMQVAADFRRTNSFEFLDTRIDKKSAWVVYRLNSSITRDGKQTSLQWLETVILTAETDQWKLNHLHSTLIGRK